jgi:hypothetical protein
MTSEKLTVSLEGVDQVIKRLGGTQDQINRASTRAIKKTTGWAGNQITRGISVSDAVPMRVLAGGGGRANRQHARIRTYRPKRTGTVGTIWIGSSPVIAAYVGAITQQKVGAKAGQHFFPGSFAALMPSGHRGVFYRNFAERLPISQEEVALLSATSVVDHVASQVPAHLKNILQGELNYEVNVRGR